MTTFAPKTLLELSAYYTQHGGRSLGIVGDDRHQATGTSYHLGESALRPGAYSAILARDKAGLSEAASAMDFGRLNDSLGEQRRMFNDFIIPRFMTLDPLTVDIREIICAKVQPSGDVTWYGYVKNALGKPARKVPYIIEHYGDASHTGHGHVSFFRDSENRSKLALFKAYFEPEVDNVQTFQTPTVPSVADVGQGAKLHSSSDLDDANPITIDPLRAMPYLGIPYKGVAMVQYTSDEPGNAPTGRVLFTKAASTTNIRPAPVPDDPTPFSQQDLDSARDAGVQDGIEAEQKRAGAVLGWNVVP